MFKDYFIYELTSVNLRRTLTYKTWDVTTILVKIYKNYMMVSDGND